MLRQQNVLKLFALGLFVSMTATSVMAQQPPQTQAPLAPAGGPVQQPINGEFIRTNQVLGIPSSWCGHVIDLMMRNQMRRQLGTGQYGGQVHLPHLSVGVKPGDLELLGVHLVCDGDACKGPTFQICMRNNSHVPIGNFKVSVVGVLGQICPHNPTADICIPRIEPCQDLQVTLQLPVTCMTMGPHSCAAPFDTVVVAVDSHDDLLECNELNNVLIVKRCDLTLVVEAPVAAAPAQGPASAGPQAVGPQQAAPQQAGPTAPQQLAPRNPGQAPSPLDNIDVDQLQPGTTQSALLNIR